MAPFGKGGGPQDQGIFVSIFMRSVAVTNCIFISNAKAQSKNSCSELGVFASWRE